MLEEKDISVAKEDLSDVAGECCSFCFPQKCGNREKSFKAGDSVVCENTTCTNGVQVLTITQILRIEVLDKHEFIIIGAAFQYVMNQNEPEHHSFSNYPVIEPSGTEIVRLASCIKRHVMCSVRTIAILAAQPTWYAFISIALISQLQL